MRNNGMKRTPQSTKSTVERMIIELNAKSEKLGWARRFDLRPGSNSNGVQHRMEHFLPDFVHPVRVVPIGATYAEALRYLETFADAMETSLAEREIGRSEVLSGESDRPVRTIYHDPDSRSARRAGEEAS